MLASLANIFRIPDLRKKVLFTLTVIALYQFGANVPVPFVNFTKVAQLTAAAKSSGVLGFLNLFSGGRSPGWPSSASGSCRTSRRASSSSCWPR